MAYANISKYYIDSKRYKEALEYLHKAEDLKSNNMTVFNNMYICYMELKDWKQAK